MIRRRLLPAALIGLVVVTAGYGAYHMHRYRVPFFAPHALPDRLYVCGRTFLPSGAVVPPDDPTLRDIGTFAPPLHERMKILGRPDLPACGMEVLVGPDDQHLTAFTLSGGP